MVLEYQGGGQHESSGQQYDQLLSSFGFWGKPLLDIQLGNGPSRCSYNIDCVVDLYDLRDCCGDLDVL